MRLQTLPNTAIGALARSIDTALMLLAGIDASFDFNFNDYLHSAFLCPAPRHCATARNGSIPDLFHFRVGNFLTSSVIIAFPFPEIECERTRGLRRNNVLLNCFLIQVPDRFESCSKPARLPINASSDSSRTCAEAPNLTK